jgi:hypothetical protein
MLEARYKLGNSTIRRIPSYDAPERARPNRVGPDQKLSDARVDEIIQYCSESWDRQVIKYNVLAKSSICPVFLKPSSDDTG